MFFVFPGKSDGVYHRVISHVNLLALWNIESMFVTEETSHALMSESNLYALRNMLSISVTDEVFHFEISP